MWIGMLLLSANVTGFHVPVAPAESLWVEVSGAGTTVVLVPGLFGSTFSFRQVTSLLHERGYRTVVIEPLGVGRSSRPHAADFSLTAQADRIGSVLDAIDVADALIVAHSIGASMALRLAYRRPELVRGVVSLDGGPAETVTSASFRGALRFAPLLKLFGGQRRMRQALINQLRNASGDPAWVTPEVIDGYVTASLADVGQTLGALQAMSRAREPESLTNHLAGIRAPVLVLIGTAPKSAGMQESELAVLAQLPSLAIERLPAVGHYVHEEAPRSVLEAVIRLDRLTAPAAERAASRNNSERCRETACHEEAA